MILVYFSVKSISRKNKPPQSIFNLLPVLVVTFGLLLLATAAADTAPPTGEPPELAEADVAEAEVGESSSP